jgi:hypothetical protein
VPLVPLTPSEKAFESQHSKAAGCTSADPYCGAVFGFWPGPVVADEARGRVLFFYGKLCRGGAAGTPCSGPTGKGLGTGIAAVDMSSGRVTRLTAVNGPDSRGIEGLDPTVFFGAGGGFGGAAATVVGNDLYVYGQCGVACQVARVPLARLTDVSRWRVYAGAGHWSANLRAGVGVIEPGGAGQTVFYDAALKAYVNVFMPYGSSKIMYQVGGSPFGPWSASRTALTTHRGAAYALFAHPEYAEKNGLVQYLTYFRPDDGSQQLVRLEFNAP